MDALPMCGTSINGTPSEAKNLHLILAYPGASTAAFSDVPRLASCLARTDEVAVVEPGLFALELNAATQVDLGDRLMRLTVRGQFGRSPTLFEAAAQLGQIKAWLSGRTDRIVWLWLTTPYLITPFVQLKATYRIARPTHDWREDLTIPVRERELAIAIAAQADLLMSPTRNSDWGSSSWFPLDPEVDEQSQTLKIESSEAIVLYQGPVDYRLDYAGIGRLIGNNPGFKLALVGPTGVMSQESRAELKRLFARTEIIHVEDSQSREAESLRRSACVGILPLGLDDLDFSPDLANLADYCRRYRRVGLVTGSEHGLSFELRLRHANILEVDLKKLCAEPIVSAPPEFLERVICYLGCQRASGSTGDVMQLEPGFLGELTALQDDLCIAHVLEAAATLEEPVFKAEHRRALVMGLRALSRAPRGYAWATLKARLAEYHFYTGAQRRGLGLMERLEKRSGSISLGARVYLDILSRHRTMSLGCGDAVLAASLGEEIARRRSALNISEVG